MKRQLTDGVGATSNATPVFNATFSFSHGHWLGKLNPRNEDLSSVIFCTSLQEPKEKVIFLRCSGSNSSQNISLPKWKFCLWWFFLKLIIECYNLTESNICWCHSVVRQSTDQICWSLECCRPRDTIAFITHWHYRLHCTLSGIKRRVHFLQWLLWLSNGSTTQQVPLTLSHWLHILRLHQTLKVYIICSTCPCCQRYIFWVPLNVIKKYFWKSILDSVWSVSLPDNCIVVPLLTLIALPGIDSLMIINLIRPEIRYKMIIAQWRKVSLESSSAAIVSLQWLSISWPRYFHWKAETHSTKMTCLTQTKRE